MPDPRVALAVFCEDIRHEVGGKHSLMGVLAGPVTITGDGPPTLTRLAVAVWLICDAGDLPAHCTITARLARAGTGLLRHTLRPAETGAIPDADTRKQIVFSAVTLPPFDVPESDVLEVWTEADGTPIRAGRLPLLHAPGTADGT
ncbi:hypothetical protein [Roseospira navarrensis]|uniref:Uncharacterized protein n=1 Tax=Roseospira navarrensis TaxID=140058 RepID=A0A7X1ZI66_9PROT|nr:hypothetical protein [Roseospira navarrensis]MQX38056.1 hypothetical protein [Roseospira navarrensis]